MKTIFIVLALLICSQTYVVPHRQDFTEFLWRFIGDNGFMGYMTFDSAGTISTYVSPTQVYWTFDNPNNRLLLKDANNVITSSFIFNQKDRIGKWRLQGRVFTNGVLGSDGSRLYLEQMI